MSPIFQDSSQSNQSTTLLFDGVVPVSEYLSNSQTSNVHFDNQFQPERVILNDTNDNHLMLNFEHVQCKPGMLINLTVFK